MKILVVIALLIAAMFVFEFYKRHPVEKFCKEVSLTDTPSNVVSKATTAGFWVNPLDGNKDSVWVFNQQAPMWRYACIVEFQGGKVSGKKVIAAE